MRQAACPVVSSDLLMGENDRWSLETTLSSTTTLLFAGFCVNFNGDLDQYWVGLSEILYLRYVYSMLSSGYAISGEMDNTHNAIKGT